MDERNLSSNVLGPRAKVSPNTINNYLRLSGGLEAVVSTKGKEKSGKLTEIERIAIALKVPALSLLQRQNEEDELTSKATTQSRLTEELLEVSESLSQHNQVLLLSLAVALKGTDA